MGEFNVKGSNVSLTNEIFSDRVNFSNEKLEDLFLKKKNTVNEFRIVKKKPLPKEAQISVVLSNKSNNSNSNSNSNQNSNISQLQASKVTQSSNKNIKSGNVLKKTKTKIINFNTKNSKKIESNSKKEKSTSIDYNSEIRKSFLEKIINSPPSTKNSNINFKYNQKKEKDKESLNTSKNTSSEVIGYGILSKKGYNLLGNPKTSRSSYNIKNHKSTNISNSSDLALISKESKIKETKENEVKINLYEYSNQNTNTNFNKNNNNKNLAIFNQKSNLNSNLIKQNQVPTTNKPKNSNLNLNPTKNISSKSKENVSLNSKKTSNKDLIKKTSSVVFKLNNNQPQSNIHSSQISKEKETEREPFSYLENFKKQKTKIEKFHKPSSPYSEEQRKEIKKTEEKKPSKSNSNSNSKSDSENEIEKSKNKKNKEIEKKPSTSNLSKSKSKSTMTIKTETITENTFLNLNSNMDNETDLYEIEEIDPYYRKPTFRVLNEPLKNKGKLTEISNFIELEELKIKETTKLSFFNKNEKSQFNFGLKNLNFTAKILIKRKLEKQPEFVIYDFSSRKFEILPVVIRDDMKIQRFYEFSIFLNIENQLYISGGKKKSKKLTKCFMKYDYSTNELIQLSDMLVKRCSHSLFYFNLKNEIYAIGGYANKTCEKYNIEKNRWNRIPNLNYERQVSTLFFCNEKYLYCSFGFMSDESFNDVEVFERLNILNNDNKTNKWEIIKISLFGVNDSLIRIFNTGIISLSERNNYQIKKKEEIEEEDDDNEETIKKGYNNNKRNETKEGISERAAISTTNLNFKDNTFLVLGGETYNGEETDSIYFLDMNDNYLKPFLDGRIKLPSKSSFIDKNFTCFEFNKYAMFEMKRSNVMIFNLNNNEVKLEKMSIEKLI